MNATIPIEVTVVFEACPVLAKLIAEPWTFIHCKPQQMPVAEALAEIVAAQMLTHAEAQHLIAELKKKASGGKIWRMSEAELFAAGLSRSKARTIHLMAEHYAADSKKFEHWRTCPVEQIRGEMNMLWGMGEWTLDMLLLRYFGHENIWPKHDASLNRVIEKLKRYCEHHGIPWKLDPNKAEPYRSYLALMFWSLEDSDQLYH